MTAIANTLALLAALCEGYCFSVLHALYLFIISIMLFISCYKSLYNLIPAFLYLVMAIIARKFVKGLKERRPEPQALEVETNFPQNYAMDCTINGIQAQTTPYPIQMVNKSENSLSTDIDPMRSTNMSPIYANPKSEPSLNADYDPMRSLNMNPIYVNPYPIIYYNNKNIDRW